MPKQAPAERRPVAATHYERMAREMQEHDAEYSDVIEALERIGVDSWRLRHWLAGPR